MKIEKPANPNYAATVVTLRDFVDLPGCDRIKAAIVYGAQVIVGRDVQPGEKGLYFPVECALSTEFAGSNNLFCKPEYGNADKAKKGFFEKHGRVKCVKFRGHRSEGFWIPIGCMSVVLGKPVYFDTFKDGDTFDKIGDFPICQKYVSRKRQGRGFVGQAKTTKPEDRIVEGQFRFHPDTQQLRRNLDVLLPDSIISVSDKWHGTSTVISHILVKRNLSLLERLARLVGVKVQESSYELVYSSRKVVKAIGNELKDGLHYYPDDPWGYWAKKLYNAGYLPQGYTVFAEIVGHTPTGSPIQIGYGYGCGASGTSRILAYRVTYTNPQGNVTDLPWKQLQGWCAARGIETVPEFYYGRADGLEPHLQGEDLRDWRDQFLNHIQENFSNDRLCQHNLGMYAEGCVVRIDNPDGTVTALKSKSYAFLEHETRLLDQGVEDIEELESTLGDMESNNHGSRLHERDSSATA